MFDSWEVTCGGCLTLIPLEKAYIEEGDRYECQACNIKYDAREYYHEHGVDVDFGYMEDIAVMADEAIQRYLRKG